MFAIWLTISFEEQSKFFILFLVLSSSYTFFAKFGYLCRCLYSLFSLCQYLPIVVSNYEGEWEYLGSNYFAESKLF